uniref:Uncharacterized protein n=1 Tax=Arundo donax TaxID=35708 RepID=A0A0A8Y2W5_ARUDO
MRRCLLTSWMRSRSRPATPTRSASSSTALPRGRLGSRRVPRRAGLVMAYSSARRWFYCKLQEVITKTKTGPYNQASIDQTTQGVVFAQKN